MSINSNSEYLSIAKPYKVKKIEEENGFWEINEKQIKFNTKQVVKVKYKRRRISDSS